MKLDPAGYRYFHISKVSLDNYKKAKRRGGNNDDDNDDNNFPMTIYLDCVGFHFFNKYFYPPICLAIIYDIYLCI